ncbi:hypothetical protein B0D78_09895 [Pyramidobacter sp. C12-8]|nr:hypothetical protein B0D78_09895 [Pyramidobacter sp. C12-8]
MFTLVLVIEGPPLMESPPLFKVTSPMETLPAAVRLRFRASFTFSAPLAESAITPILSSVSFETSAPPLIFSVSPSFLPTGVPPSPANFRPSSIVATW